MDKLGPDEPAEIIRIAGVQGKDVDISIKAGTLRKPPSAVYVCSPK
jgi:hypothetical protein